MRKMTSQVTRASVMELARLPHHNLHVVERELPMADVLDMIRWPVQTFSITRSGGKLPKNIFFNFHSNIPRGGQLLEMFATGTAACVVPVR